MTVTIDLVDEHKTWALTEDGEAVTCLVCMGHTVRGKVVRLSIAALGGAPVPGDTDAEADDGQA